MKKLFLLTVLLLTFNIVMNSQSNNELRKNVADFYSTRIGETFKTTKKRFTKYNGELKPFKLRLDSIKVYTIKKVDNSPDGGSYVHRSHMITVPTTSTIYHIDDIYFSALVGEERKIFVLTWEHENGLGDYIDANGVDAITNAPYQIDFDNNKVYIIE